MINLILRATLVLTIAFSLRSVSRAELKPGADLLPYEIHNTENGKEYCQMCAYSSRPATVAAYGKLGDEAFWTDLQRLQKLQGSYREFGCFGQVLDSTDSKAIQDAAKQHGITFPVVFAVDPDWEKTYQVKGISRTVYFSRDFKVEWSSVGLDDKGLAAITDKLKNGPQS